MASSSPCNVLQANLHQQTFQLRRWLEVNSTALVLIQEPWVRQGRICGLPNTRGKLIQFTGPESSRSCIFITNNLLAQPLTEFCSRDICAITLLDTTTHQPKMVVASVYMPDEDSPPHEELAKLLSHCESANLELLVATDCNGYHPLWGMQFRNERGRQLVEYLFPSNLNILNVGSEPTFVTRRCKTIVDITLATEGVSNIISIWHVSREASCSDNRWIRFNIEVNTNNPSPGRKPRKTNPALKTMMESRLKEVVFPERLVGIDNIKKQVTCVHDAIVTCYHAACPPTTPPSGKPKAQS
ncbi:unnamed protein product [Euphydryas editha]|uniref:Endonuclease/exonuclease/phosphatase domain-containing protein n=1 Tax=Euphydryas editha TaxID=104508 RepID=A0AAU9T9Z5_EUPED|nr:unnamed protein product [Euphydryas editha]